MEEILASIRRIISGDDVTKPADRTEASAAVPEPRPATVAAIPTRPRPFPSRAVAAPGSTARPDADEHWDRGAAAAELKVSSAERSSESLLSSKTRAAIDNAFNSLAGAVSGQNAPTVEDLAKEMLRPMLKVWLDENLPSLVERLVRAEIERLARGR
jgi:cell pole-organizing protein PopZ